MLKNAFDTAIDKGKCWLWREVFKSLIRDIAPNGDHRIMRRQFDQGLDYAALMADRHPELTLSFAANLYARDRWDFARDQAVGLILAHAEDAWRRDPAMTRQAIQSAVLVTRESRVEQRLLATLYRLAPELEPGPWGSRNDDLPPGWVTGAHPLY